MAIFGKLAPSFEALRAEIHGAPSAGTASRVRAWAAAKPADTAALAIEIADRLDVLYGAEGRRDRIVRHREQLMQDGSTRALAEQLGDAATGPPEVRLHRLSGLVRDLHSNVTGQSASARARLRLLDLLIELEGEIAITSNEALAHMSYTRGELLAIAALAVDAAYGSGFVTDAEHASVAAALGRLVDVPQAELIDYVAAVDSLKRMPQWAAGSIRHAFAEPLVRYAALDARAASFVDDLMRSSALVGLAEIARTLAADVAALTGVPRLIDGREGLPAWGLNAGIARGQFRVVTTDQSLRTGSFAASDIVLLPETTPELSPVAGIVTLGEGNPLSHVQLLARNFGIPNIAVAPSVLAVLEPMQDREIVAAVATDGSLVVVPAASVPREFTTLLQPASERRALLRVPPPDLAVTVPIALERLDGSLSGRVVGPKAANLGELARLFPGHVAPAIAIPFGFYAEHVGHTGESPRARLITAYAERRAGLLDDAELGTVLADVRDGIARVEIDSTSRAALLEAMRQEFGNFGAYGLYVRSDTNVEDLPEFMGAGLSETVPNVTGIEALFRTIPRVWASILSPRAIAWRSNLLENPESVFASVLLTQSVPSTKSGVLVTAHLVGGRPGLTVSAAWGVGGGVGGEATESLVLHADGSETLVSGAKSAYQRVLDPSGGLSFVPAPEGAVLTAREKDILRTLAADVLDRYEPVFDGDGGRRPWDIEYGFVNGDLTLFQIRPLVELGQRVADRVVKALAPPQRITQHRVVALDEMPASSEFQGQGF